MPAELARRARIKLLYNNKDISADLAPHLKFFTYNDVLSGAADDIDLTLEDRAGRWRGGWLPEKGALLQAALVKEHWPEGVQELELGLFELDEIEVSGSPEEVKIKAVSVPDNSALRGVDKTRSWEKTSLSVIAKDIAAGSGMELFYDTPDDPKLERAEQTEQSDLSFLLDQCDKASLALKISGNRVIIFDEAKYEQAEPAGKIIKGVSPLISYSFRSATREVYAACRVKYQNSTSKRKIEYTFTLPDKQGKTLQVNEEVSSTGEAEKLAKKRLREKNREEITASLALAGDFIYAAGNVFELEGFGALGGRYIVTRAAHSVGGGYTARLDLRRCLNGY